jgi:diaminopimelate decarboxylase
MTGNHVRPAVAQRPPPANDEGTNPCARFDGVDLATLAERVGTPFYAYSASGIRARVASLLGALSGLDAVVCYAVKANPSLGVLRTVAEAGLGADIVSAGELARCIRAGIPPTRIVFSGVGKADAEIEYALGLGIWKLNVESHEELLAIDRIARRLGVTVQAAVRVNPDVDANTHAKISTGKAENKFGVPVDEARRWFAEGDALTHVRLNGLHAHIGSQITELGPFRLMLGRLASLARELAAAGHEIETIDVGGGLGVAYKADEQAIDVADYGQALREGLAGFGGHVVLEPGRWLVAAAGVLVARVLRVKRGTTRRFLVLDAAMNDLQRPAMYGAWHDIVPLHDTLRPTLRYDVVGPVCESGDTFAVERALPACEAGDLVVIATAGAYGAAMASTYNSRPLVAEVMLDRGRYAIARPRQTLAQLLAAEPATPDWETT